MELLTREWHTAHLELPVQAPTKFQLVVKAAKELGLEIPATVLAQADEVA
jgi:hypothetical protein